MTIVKENATQDVATQNNNVSFPTVDLTKPLPSLDDAQSVPFDLMADYWTPETPGESKRMFFDRIDVRGVKDMNSEDIIDLECAFFLENINGEVKSVSNGSKRLVGALQANNIKRGTPLLVTYLGKKTNKTNSFKSDSWSVKPLVVNI
jgi:hypothetical protein